MKDNRKTIRVVAEVVLAVLLIAVIYFLIRYMWVRNERVAAELATETQDGKEWVELDKGAASIKLGERTYEFSHPVKTYLIMGTDASGNEEAFDDTYQGAMADALMLVMVDDEDESYGILQLNRDTITEITMLQKDGSGYASADMQLCTAHWYGADKQASCENTVQAVSDMLGGLPIDGYYALQMKAVPLLNEAVGGVSVTFEEDLTELDPQMKAGETITLTDEQADLLLRSRMSLKDDRNSERMSRQQIFFNAFFKQVQKENGADTNFVINLYDRLHPYATEDININELTAMLKNMDTYTNKGIFTIDGESKLGEKLGDGKEHWEFYMDDKSLENVMCELYPFDTNVQ